MSNATDPRSCGQVTAVAVHPTLGNGGLVFVETNSHRLTAQLVGNAVPRVGDTLRLLVLGSVFVTDPHGNSRPFALDLMRASLASDADRAERLQRIGEKPINPTLHSRFGRSSPFCLQSVAARLASLSWTCWLPLPAVRLTQASQQCRRF